MKKLLAVVLVIMLAVCMAACTDETTGGGADSETGKVVTEDTVFGINETAVCENLKITATELQESKGVEFFEAEEGNVFVGVKFEIENISDEDQNISSLLMIEAYLDDVACDYSISGMMAFGDGSNTLDGTIAPGKKLIGYYAVEVAEDWNELEFQIQPDVLDDKKVKFVFGK